ncbi:uncharacterized protein LOC113769243 [Coffea eugenioides]|uniref:uncharacterized protein LOC113769243 n=1 Tax=Coffea eugenioides TaxID=49369 RepID=UPI000F60D306|nr:uncharacterized protein LOC113769243 [Coffea eugenioides]
MAPYEALYGRKCRSPIHWDEVGERKIIDSATIPWVEEAYARVKVIRQRLQTAQNRQKSYADHQRKDLEFENVDKVFLRITPLKGKIEAGKGKKLQPRYIGPFNILQQIGNVAYRLEQPASLSRIHDVFHVSLLKKYHPDPTHILPPEDIELDESLTYEERPIRILDRKVKDLRNKQIPLVKVLWRHHEVEEVTWELEKDMQEKYPELFTTKLTGNSMKVARVISEGSGRMEEALECAFKKFDLSEIEIGGIDLSREDIKEGVQDYGSLVGKLMGENVANFTRMKNFTKHAWGYP